MLIYYSITLNRSVRIEILVSFLIVAEKILVFHYYDVSCGLFIYGLNGVEIIYSCSKFIECFLS